MISRTPAMPNGGSDALATRPAPGSWRRELAAAVTRPQELLELLDLPASLLPEALQAGEDFSLRVPRGFVARMQPGRPDDPLLRQVLPVGEELVEQPGFVADPLAEGEATAVPGLLHKYFGRALVVAVGACAVHCRYCFRRHFPYGENRLGELARRRILDYLAGDPTLREVILSGGDPLMLRDEALAELAGELAAIPHLRRLRIHSRIPIVLPERVDDDLLAWLAGGRLRPVMVVHANHAQEIGPEVAAAARRLRQAEVQVLNQSVLLRGVNDSAAALEDLSEALFEAGIQPYYLHLLDPVAGAAHFAVTDETARRIVARLASRLPGYLVPKLVREEPGRLAKTPIPISL